MSYGGSQRLCPLSRVHAGGQKGEPPVQEQFVMWIQHFA
jgi:hypothetical protein